MAHAVVPMPMMARRMARKRRMAFQRKVASSAYMAEREGRAMVRGAEDGRFVCERKGKDYVEKRVRTSDWWEHKWQ